MSQKDNHFTQYYGTKYTGKILHLERRLTQSKTGDGRFIVLPFEAGLGKSRETDRIIGEYIANGGKRKFLLVKRFNEDVVHSADRINALQPEWSASVSLGITKDNWGEHRTKLDELASYDVIVITHVRYGMLCKDVQTRSYFERNRHTLIIDEALSVSPCEFSMSIFDAIQGRLQSFILKDSCRAACDGLIIELSVQSSRKYGNRLVVCRPQPNWEHVNQFARDIEANRLHIKDYGEVQKFVDSLYALYQNECIFNGGKSQGRLVTYNKTAERWTLKNNIILDANGLIDRQYKVDPAIHIDRQTPIVDHSYWTLYHVDFNSSDSHIRGTVNYFEEISKKIVERKKSYSRTLVVTRLKHVETLNACLSQHNVNNTEVTYFGNIIGKNEWREFDQVWIVATPLYRMEDYAIRWAEAKRAEFGNKNLKMVVQGGTLRFVNKDFEAVRFGCVVGEIYQAIKRIDRDNVHHAEVYVVNSDTKVIHELTKHMKGIKFGGIIELNVRKRSGGDGKPKHTKADELATYLKSLEQGIYTKADIRDAIGFEKSNFGRLLKDDKIKRLELAGLIRINRHTIEVLARDGLKRVG